MGWYGGDGLQDGPPPIWQQIANARFYEEYGRWPNTPKIFLETGNRGWRGGQVPRGANWLVSALTSKEAAARMQNREASQQIIGAIDQSISNYLDSDDICPPWSWPGPPPWLSMIASELTFIANTLQEGSLRNNLLEVAGRVLDRAALNPPPLPP
jgi:hypothetical protein